MREFATLYPPEDIAVDEAPIVRGPDGPWDEDEIIDTVLRLVADHHRTIGAAIGRRSYSHSLAELRQSPLGQDLRLLAMAAYGDVDDQEVQERAGRVTDLLLRPLAAEHFVIPAWFWTTAIGRIVARAARASYGTESLMPLAEAARRLGVDPPLIERWVSDGGIAAIPDEAGQYLVPRDEIERRRLIARELAGWQSDKGEDVLVQERRLAS
jgi:excisionase family DNA binding protein